MALVLLYVSFGVASLLIIARQYQKYRWGRCTSDVQLNGKTVIVTGANTGLGKATALELAKRKARVILACRDVESAANVVNEIRKHTNEGELVVRHLDLASLESIRSFVNSFCNSERRLDILINNAGIYHCPFMTTKDGFEMQFGVNYLGPFLLTNLLLDKLKECAPSRIVVVASAYYRSGKIDFDNLNSERGYDKGNAYKNSKLANVYFVRQLAKHLAGTGVDVVGLCPGMALTNIARHLKLSWWKIVLLLPFLAVFVKTAKQGAQTILHCALAEEVEGTSGAMYANCKRSKVHEVALDDNIAENLWDVSTQLTKLKV